MRDSGQPGRAKRNFARRGIVGGTSVGAVSGRWPMVDERHLEEQIERCRRLASSSTDEDLRRSLEALAKEYEERLKRKGAGFMLQRRD